MSTTLLQATDSTREESRNVAFAELNSGKHTGAILGCMYRLRPKLPFPNQDLVELESVVQSWAVEAALRYDLNMGTKFVTLLWRHLQIRSRNYIRYCHSRFRRVRPESSFDNDELKSIEALTHLREDITEELRSEELMARLSPESRLVLGLIKANAEEICKLGSRRPPAWATIAQFLEIPLDTLKAAIAEIQSAYEACF